jgi:hypothetical protein
MTFLILLLGIYIGGAIATACGGIVSIRDGNDEVSPEEALFVVLCWPMMIFFLVSEIQGDKKK